MGPVCAFKGTVVLSWLLSTTAKTAGKPPKRTEVEPVKFEPDRITFVPGSPLEGEKPLTTGAP